MADINVVYDWLDAAPSLACTCLCRGVRMNDRSSGDCVFHSISSIKQQLFAVSKTRGDRRINVNNVSAALLDFFKRINVPY